MLSKARAAGIPNFHIFGEVFTDEVDPGVLAYHTRVDRLPAVLDFAFAAAVRRTVAGDAGTEVLARLFAGDALYEGGEAAALELPTFVSNHDAGRFAYFVRRERPGIGEEETVKRVLLAHAMLFTLRGVPVVYYGDEQGFSGLGGDQDARQDMFATRVSSYLSEKPLGGTAGGGGHFDGQHPLYRAIGGLARLRTGQAALRRGRQLLRSYGPVPGLFAVSRFDPDNGRELLIAFNTSTEPLDAQVMIEATSRDFSSLHGECPREPSAPGSYRIELAPLEYVVCASAAGS
jgi:glycosidase